MTKDVIAAILERRSVRKFKSDPVPQATIGRILDAGVHAPSGGNLQPWKFFVVLNEGKKAELAAAALNQRFVAQAPVVIVVCAEPDRSGKTYGARGRDLYCLQDTAAAVQNMLLAATGYGLGSCWVGAFNEDMVRAVIGAGEHLRPVAMIPIGFPDGEAKSPARRPAAEVVEVID